ncbi:MAG: IS30 family transposase, partial [Clostridium perfringens]|uniref:IS30 family transposase n=1 Tax=Clostridium sp. TaxID=1506 RepID=UPI00290DDD61
GRFTIKRTIKERSQEVEDRNVFGHWALDTMVSSRGQSKGCLATFVERKTRFYIAVKMEDRTKDPMFLAISSLYNTLTSKLRKTFTVDRGKEFACYEQVETKFGIPMYFADAYVAWQRGTNENSNGLLREFFPKKTDLAKVTLDKLREALMLINNRPRCVGFKTPFDMLKHEIRKLI